MKTIVDYLKKHKTFIGQIGGYELKLELKTRQLIIEANNQRCVFNPYKPDIDGVVQEAFENMTSKEIRFCDECGKPYDAGYIACDGDWYCCEACFEPTMDKDYGKKKWRSTKEEGIYGGLYEYLNTDGEWEDTGIYWTEWN